MNIVVVGGGPTGVELAGALAEMKKYILPKDYPELDFDRMQVFLLEGSNRLLASISEKACAKAQQYLEKLDVQVSLNWAWNYFTYDQSLRLLIKASTKPQTNKSDE
jgi:NADH dehydrogenase